MKPPIDDSTDYTKITPKFLPIPKPVKLGMVLILSIVLLLFCFILIGTFLFMILGLGLSGDWSLINQLMPLYISLIIGIVTAVWMLRKIPKSEDWSQLVPLCIPLFISIAVVVGTFRK